jgi:periplasmic protein TonB
LSAARRVLLALWLSLAVHAAIIGMVRVAPRTAVPMEQVLEARLETPAPQRPPAVEALLLLSPGESARLISVPEIRPVVLRSQPPVQPEAKPQPAAESLPVGQASAESRPNNPEPVKSEAGPTIDVPLAVDSHYYTAKELDVQPRPVHKIVPLYPSEYEAQGVTGYAILEMRVETDGQVGDLTLAEISPTGYEAFGREALKAFRDAKFVPARRKGQPVRALFRVKIVFELEE